jgi:hypothetical protein
MPFTFVTEKHFSIERGYVMQQPDNSDYNPNVNVMSSILKQLREKADVGVMRQAIRENESVFQAFYEEFDGLKQVGMEGASVEVLECVMAQLSEVLTLFGIDHPANFIMRFDPGSPYIDELIDSGWHVSNLLWSASKQSTDEGFSTMYNRVIQEVADRKLFELIQLCYREPVD